MTLPMRSLARLISRIPTPDTIDFIKVGATIPLRSNSSRWNRRVAMATGGAQCRGHKHRRAARMSASASSIAGSIMLFAGAFSDNFANLVVRPRGLYGSRPARASKDRIITPIGDETGWTTPRSLGEVGMTSVHSKPVCLCSDCTFLDEIHRAALEKKRAPPRALESPRPVASRRNVSGCDACSGSPTYHADREGFAG